MIKLFDTSVVKSKSIDYFRDLSSKNIIFASPYVFYEIIDEIVDDNSLFEIKNKHIPKFNYIRILQDPWFEIDYMYLTDFEKREYGSDQERVNLLCKVIDESDSIRDICKMVITESNGRTRGLKEIFKKTEESLIDESNRFLLFANNIIQYLIANPQKENNHEKIRLMIRSMVIGRLKQKKDNYNDNELNIFLNLTYFFYTCVYYFVLNEINKKQKKYYIF